MSALATLVMYHYVRPLAGSRWPEIKGLELRDFETQLEYFIQHYQIISLGELARAVRENRLDDLPPRPMVLTFDDGFADHYLHAWPLLEQKGLSGTFFPPTAAVLKRELNDTHKLHFILAGAADMNALVSEVEKAMDAARASWQLPTTEALRQEYARASRFDPAEVIYVKRLLQHALPEALRHTITGELFERYVSRDPRSFADELYLSLDQIRQMHGRGAEFGLHGHDHVWLNTLAPQDQARDIDASMELLGHLGLPAENFLFCYPFGGFNDQTLELLRERHCAAAVTTRAAVAELTSETDLLCLPRLDTNDFPPRGSHR